MIDFKVIHKAVKDHVNSKGFSYKTIGTWFNFEMGSFPASAHNNAYAIKPGTGQQTDEYEAYDWDDTVWTIEFCLEGLNDKYLTKMGEVRNAVKTLLSISHTNIAEIESMGFNMQNYDKYVILSYDIKITINE